ncbi:fatty acid desaturase [Cognatishimia maritima]|uniref:Omega-6 fatty acid desaturase (Delta-12 desaturase) n=1 Tax=Cognatishimia maritima TaxID=870908 RepID=A0A1M5MQY8_9RHOB|nr:fatty acid desaturase [Cognatishimia maritima]SHG79721.1 omega-6 fatty acid desaturase (delta-12 desaturase) [Cognatishimia maritima]
MFDLTSKSSSVATPTSAKEWVRILSKYRTPKLSRSLFELVATLVPFVTIWALAWAAMSISYGLAVAIALLNGPFLVRLFAIQHDCGHRSFVENRKFGDWIGRCLGVLTVTPYEMWRHAHAVHHSASGNLDRRGLGDIRTMTVREYNEASTLERLYYRIYRNPIMTFLIAPGILFLLVNRLPFGFMDQRKFWISAMGNNLGLLALLGPIYLVGGWAPILLIFLPSTIFAASIGVWLFYVQHQFEHAHWENEHDWDMHEAALHGSSHYVLPPLLQWLSANIGIHHVHHLQSRIPFYRLPEVLRDHKDLAVGARLTIRESLQTAKLHLWDEDGKRLLSYKEARDLVG